jgi:Mg2+/citrate symporter
MKATAFEVRYATLVRLCLILAAFGMYLFDPDDVVWRFIRDLPARRALEHGAFLAATLLIGAGAWLATHAAAFARNAEAGTVDRAGLLGELLYAIGLATLAPLWGAVLLTTGEAVRVLRLELAGAERNRQRADTARWRLAVRRQAAKWGVFLTMIVFTVTLIDRVANYGILTSAAVWIVLNWPEVKTKYCRAPAAPAPLG